MSMFSFSLFSPPSHSHRVPSHSNMGGTEGRGDGRTGVFLICTGLLQRPQTIKVTHLFNGGILEGFPMGTFYAVSSQWNLFALPACRRATLVGP